MFYGSTPAAASTSLSHADSAIVLEILDEIATTEEEFDALLGISDAELGSLLGTVGLFREDLRSKINPIATRLLRGEKG